MLPPVKRATLTADTLLSGYRSTSSNPPLWKSVKGPRKGEHKTDIRALVTAADEIDLLDLLEKYPGQTGTFYADRMRGRTSDWVRVTLLTYQADGLVKSRRGKGLAHHWYLAAKEEVQ